MSTRAYDYIITLSDASSFVTGNSVIGASSLAVAEVIAKSGSNLKVKMANVSQSFISGETLNSNTIILSSYNVFSNVTSFINGVTNTFPIPISGVADDSIIVYENDYPVSKDYWVRQDSSTIQFLPRLRLVNSTSEELVPYTYPDTSISSLVIQAVSGDVKAYSFMSANYSSEVTTASSTITAINNTPYISEKNSTQQTPLVKLYTIYYPGEWYPGNSNNNPSGSGDGFPWPKGFPLRYAEVVGESYSDFNYAITYNNIPYRVVGVDSGDISVDSTGKIGELSLTLSNFDGVIASIVENKNILGFNASNNFSAIVNNELVQNIDPRTVIGNEHYDANVVAYRGSNAVWDYSSTIENGDVWTNLKSDTRDLLGAVVEIKYTYAKFLDHWPEYSIVRDSSANSANVYSSLPYRIGDSVTSNSLGSTSTIVDIQGNKIVFEDTNLSFISPGSKLLIINPDADPASHIDYVYTINRLDELDEFVAKFSLTNWLQYFKMKLPKRKFVNTTCPWKYKGDECKYPVSGAGVIKGSNPPISANGYFTYSNEPTLDANSDICAKTLKACSLRKNLVNFGGFPGIVNE